MPQCPVHLSPPDLPGYRDPEPGPSAPVPIPGLPGQVPAQEGEDGASTNICLIAWSWPIRRDITLSQCSRLWGHPGQVATLWKTGED